MWLLKVLVYLIKYIYINNWIIRFLWAHADLVTEAITIIKFTMVFSKKKGFIMVVFNFLYSLTHLSIVCRYVWEVDPDYFEIKIVVTKICSILKI